MVNISLVSYSDDSSDDSWSLPTRQEPVLPFHEEESESEDGGEQAEAGGNSSSSPRHPFFINQEDQHADLCGSQLPLGLLNAAVLKPVLVELKNGETVNGILISSDTWMNLILKEVVQTNAEGTIFTRLTEIYIRGNNIKYIRVSDDVIEQWQASNAQQAASRGGRGGSSHSRGGRGGEGRGGGRGGGDRGGRGGGRGRGRGA